MAGGLEVPQQGALVVELSAAAAALVHAAAVRQHVPTQAGGVQEELGAVRAAVQVQGARVGRLVRAPVRRQGRALREALGAPLALERALL